VVFLRCFPGRFSLFPQPPQGGPPPPPTRPLSRRVVCVSGVCELGVGVQESDTERRPPRMFDNICATYVLLQCVAVFCSMLQRVAVCCSALVRCSVFSRRCSVLQYVAVRRSALQIVDTPAGDSCQHVLQCFAMCCSVLQCVAVCCSVLQCVLQCAVEC